MRQSDQPAATPRPAGIGSPARPRVLPAVLAGVAALGIALGLTGCFATAAPSGTVAPNPVASMAQPIPTGDGTLVIGAVVPLSGGNAVLGAAELAGVELAARDIDAAGGFNGRTVVVLHGDAGDAASTRAAETIAAFAGRVDALVGPNSQDVVVAADAAAKTAGVAGMSAVADPEPIDDAFAARLRTADPSLSDTRFGAESYDATVMIALAAVLAGDDGATSIARFLPAVTAGAVTCSSYGACLDAVGSGAGIRYTGVTGVLALAPASTAPGSLMPVGITG